SLSISRAVGLIPVDTSRRTLAFLLDLGPMRTLRRMRWSWFGSRSGAGCIEREWYRLQILHEPSRQPPAFAIKLLAAMTNDRVTGGLMNAGQFEQLLRIG